MQRRVLPFLVLGILLCAAVPAQAVITVSFGNHTMNQGESKTFAVTVTSEGGDPEISAVDLYIEIGDGNTGPYPFATNVDMLTGTTFSVVSSSQAAYGDPWEVENGTSTGYKPAFAVFANATTAPNGDVPATGDLANITWDSTGAPIGVYQVFLTSQELGDTLVGSLSGLLNINDQYFIEAGTIEVIPEPSSIVMGLFAAAGLAAVATRRLRRRKAA